MSRYTLSKYISRLMAVLLVLTLLLSAVPTVYAEGESGTCGDQLSWTLSAGTLTITGSGDMTDFHESTMAPWYDLREEILRLELPDGLTSVGDLAFYGCANIQTVTIPDSVERIGKFAFTYCSGIEMLSLGNSLKTIGESAFSDCYALASLRLPASLQSIGLKAFYRCESITTVTVPSGVTSIGMSAFAYCKDLVSADVQAQITTIPEWMFYGCEKLVSVTLPDSADEISEFAFRGCDSLNTVYYDGSNKTTGEIQQIINSDVPGFDTTGFVSNGQESSEVTSGTVTENDDGTITQENTTVNRSESATVSTTVTNTHPADAAGGNYSADITITVEGESGWSESQKALEDALKKHNDTVAATGGTSEKPNITVYVKNTSSIDQAFIDSINGRDVTMTIITQDGSSWRVEGSEQEDTSDEYNFSYTITAGTAELCQELGTTACYVVRFHAPAAINAEVLMHLGSALSMQNATLFQRGDELSRIQSTVVDKEGYAHFYLGSVDDKTEYYIAMNLPDVEDAIIPQELSSDYGNPEYVEPIRYEITGRKSSWGMTFSQVTWILAGVLVGCVIIVGFVMFMLNKRKLRMGYVPDLEDEDLV